MLFSNWHLLTGVMGTFLSLMNIEGSSKKYFVRWLIGLRVYKYITDSEKIPSSILKYAIHCDS